MLYFFPVFFFFHPIRTSSDREYRVQTYAMGHVASLLILLLETLSLYLFIKFLFSIGIHPLRYPRCLYSWPPGTRLATQSGRTGEQVNWLIWNQKDISCTHQRLHGRFTQTPVAAIDSALSQSQDELHLMIPMRYRRVIIIYLLHLILCSVCVACSSQNLTVPSADSDFVAAAECSTLFKDWFFHYIQETSDQRVCIFHRVAAHAYILSE